MSDKGQSNEDSFDLDQLKQLIRLMEKYDLTEVKLQGGQQKWVLRRGQQGGTVGHTPVGMPPMASAPVPVSPPAAQAVPAPAEGVAASEASADDGLIEITSPTVGTYYGAPQPGDPPFVKVGDRVSPESVVCIVEAMKVFNQIPAEVTGTVRQILVQEGDAVDFGQALFRVKPD